MRIFGRDTTREHRKLGDICADLTSSPDPNDRAFAWNMLHDRRINEAWGEYWYREYGPARSSQTLRDSLTGYHNRLRDQPIAAYADLESVVLSEVRFGSPGSPSEGDSLVHILDLWSPGAKVVWNYGAIHGIGPLASLG